MKKPKPSSPPAASPPAAISDRPSPDQTMAAASPCKRCQSAEITKRTYLRTMTHSGMQYVWNLLTCKCGQIRPERIATRVPPVKARANGR